MTPQKRAEKIVDLVYNRVDHNGEWDRRNLAVEDVAAQIEEAESEAVLEFVTLQNLKDAKLNREEDLMVKESYAEGFNAAREKAKGIAEGDGHLTFHGEDCHKFIAQRIREMEP